MKKVAKMCALPCYLLSIILCLYFIPDRMITIIAIHILVIFLCATPILLVLKYTKSGTYYVKIARGKIFAIITKQEKAKHLSIAQNVIINNSNCIKIGNNVSIDHDAEFYPLGQFKGIRYPSKITIGNNVSIGAYNRFASCDNIEIEDDVLFAAYVHITDHSHEFRDITLPVLRQGIFEKKQVKIGKGSWLGFRCNILSGVTIGEHCVIAAGAVVTKDVPSYSVVAGIPAKVIKQYDFTKKEWVSV
ncbi:MAG: acyltransferase [Lachnospiraceae bacterium]